MADSYFKMNGNVMIQRKSGIDSQFFYGPNHNFEIRAENSPITGTTNSSEDNATSDQLAIYSDNTKLWGITEHGYVVNPNRPCFFVTPSANYTPSGSNEIFKANYALYNIGNMYDTSTYRFTAPMNGLYLFGGMYRKDANLSYVHWMVYLNGTSVSAITHGLIGLNTTGYSGFTAGAMVYQLILSAGDYIDFYIYNPNASIINTQSYLHGVFLG